ncbi:MAG: BRO family protein [Ferruginibacter sp.]
MDNQPAIFEKIKKTNEIGQEYWSARELFTALEYIKWDKFLNVIAKAKEACENSGQPVQDHFPRVEKMVVIGSSAQRDIGDLHLTRYACYLIIQNADPSKEVVALGQTYFAIQTRKQELLEDALKNLAAKKKSDCFYGKKWQSIINN